MSYLLGNLSEEEKSSLEEQVFSDDAEFEEVEIAEDELVDRYIRNELSEKDRQSFEQTLRISPRLHERVSFARVLANRLTTTATPEIGVISPAKSTGSFWNWLLGRSPSRSLAGRLIPSTALALLLIGAIISFVGWLRLRDTNRQLTVERARVELEKSNLEREVQTQKLRTDQLASQLQTEIDQRQAQDKLIQDLQSKVKVNDSAITFLSLFSGTVRSEAGGNRLVIGPGTSQVRLTLYVGPVQYTKYIVSISTPEGRVIYTNRELRSHGKFAKTAVTVQIAASLLARGDYIVKIEGIKLTGASEPVADYSFHVDKR